MEIVRAEGGREVAREVEFPHAAGCGIHLGLRSGDQATGRQEGISLNEFHTEEAALTSFGWQAYASS